MRATAQHLPDARAIVRLFSVVMVIALFAVACAAVAHDISQADRAAVARIEGPAPGAFLYLGAKHMVTGIDHILFLVGVIFFLYKLRDVVVYVTMFTIGHSTTLLLGVLLDTGANAYIVDAIIGLSIVYKGFENMGGFKALGVQPNTRAAVLCFGFVHGFGLATKLQDFNLSRNGLVTNIVSFNVGVEIGQLMIVVVAAGTLALIRQSSASAARLVAVVGSTAVIAAGTYWFVQRVFFV